MRWVAVAGLALAISCGGVEDVQRDPEPLLQTSELRYPLQRHDFAYSATIPYHFRNETGGVVHLDNCRGDIRPLLQVLRDGRWVDAWHPRTETCQSPPVVVQPDDTLRDTLSVVGAPPASNVTPAFVFEDVEGVYRLLWFQARRAPQSGEAEGAILDTRFRVSNPFVLAFP